MSYLNDSLSEGETLRAEFAQHWITRKWLLLYLLLAGAASALAAPLGLALWLLPAWEWLRLVNIEHGLTNKRVIYKTGIISRHSEEMKLSSIETVEITQSIAGRLLGYGTVRITGRGVSELPFHELRDPLAVKRAIESVEPPADSG